MSYILTLSCPDQAGLIAAFSSEVAKAGCNITEAAQYSDNEEKRFFMRLVLDAEKPKAIEKLSGALKKLEKKLALSWQVHDGSCRVKTVLLTSKEDHCLNDILYRWRTGHLPIDITGVISNHETARPLVEAHGLPYHFLQVAPDNKQETEANIAAIIQETATELVVLARYMQILSDDFCQQHAGRIINIHHSFLPGFKGAKPYHQAHDRGVKLIGATAHFVTADLDEGPIIEQDIVRVTHAHTPQEMQVLGRDTEALVLSRAIAAYAQRRIFMHGARTVIL